MIQKYLYINTIGCQMNVYDTERMAGRLEPMGYLPTTSPEKADLILINTCTIREKAEQKAFSFLGRLAGVKKQKPDVIVGIAGCLAQQEGRNLLKRFSHLDLVLGTQAVTRLPERVQTIENERCRIVDVEMTQSIDTGESVFSPLDGRPVSRFVTIMQGCDNYCTYCVVPYVRGREMSRHPDRIIREIKELVRTGVREVTLLGQNVNSYGKKEGLCSFPELLEQIHTLDGLWRIRFTTSHPKDLSGELIRSFKDLNKLCSHIHLPVQSGSNLILARMNRKYSREQYLEKVDRLRHTCPDIAVTSDMIAGFPGETDRDFQDTLDLIRRVAFDGLYAFMYSDRPNAPAERFEPKVSDLDKILRLQEILKLQEEITAVKNGALVGTDQSVLIEGKSKKGEDSPSLLGNAPVQWTGRTDGNKIVNFPQVQEPGLCRKISSGQMATIRIERALSHSLWGRPVKIEGRPGGLKGEASYAA